MKYIYTFENHSNGKYIGDKPDINSSIKNLKKLPKDLKDVAQGFTQSITKAKNGKVTGLSLHPDLISKIEKGGYPNGFSMGIDKDGYFIHTHRARSKSYKSPSDIPVKDIKFIDSTG